MASWDAEQYLKYDAERTRPARELAAAVRLDAPTAILDAGCGPGNSTAVLAARWPSARLTGLDASPVMLDRARVALPGAAFIQGDLNGDLSGLGRFDVVFSNAALQWLSSPEGTAEKLFALVKPGGALAVQVPQSHPAHTGGLRLESGDAHRLLCETAAEPPFAAWTEGATRLTDFSGARMYDRLVPLASALDLWETTYCHVLDGYDGLAEWYRGTGMRPYLDRLPDNGMREAFVRRFVERAAAEYPRAADGKLLLWFRRVFLIAYRV